MRVQNVVVGIDFGETSIAAARWAARNLAIEGRLVLLHALEEVVGESWMHDLSPPSPLRVQAATIEAHDALLELADTLGREDVICRVATGDPAECLLEMSDEYAADLVIVGAPLLPGSEVAGLFAGVAEQLAENSPAPVLVWRGGETGLPRQLLAAVRGGTSSDRILAWAQHLRMAWGAEVTVMHAVPDHRSSPWGRAGSWRVLATGGQRDTFRRLRRRAEAAGLDRRCRYIQVDRGEPAQRIAAAVLADGMDLVLVGRSQWRALHQSVSTEVARAAACSVLVLPEDWTAPPVLPANRELHIASR